MSAAAVVEEREGAWPSQKPAVRRRTPLAACTLHTPLTEPGSFWKDCGWQAPQPTERPEFKQWLAVGERQQQQEEEGDGRAGTQHDQDAAGKQEEQQLQSGL